MGYDLGTPQARMPLKAVSSGFKDHPLTDTNEKERVSNSLILREILDTRLAYAVMRTYPAVSPDDTLHALWSSNPDRLITSSDINS